jgi:hypothetical protein
MGESIEGHHGGDDGCMRMDEGEGLNESNQSRRVVVCRIGHYSLSLVSRLFILGIFFVLSPSSTCSIFHGNNNQTTREDQQPGID